MSRWVVFERKARLAGAVIAVAAGASVPATALDGPVHPSEIIELAPDGVWTWYNDERAVVHGGKIFAGYVTSRGKVKVSSYDLATRRVAQSEPLNSWTQADDHNNPSILALADGRLLVLYARHFGTAFQTRTTLNPGSVSAWEEEKKYDPQVQITFSHLLGLTLENQDNPNGRIFNFTRAYVLDPCLTYSDDNGASWSDLIHMVESTVARSSPYTKMSGNGRDRIDMILTDGHPRNRSENSIYHCYYRYNPGEQRGAFYRTDGTWLTTFASLKQGGRFAPENGTKVYDGASASGRAWVHDVARDERGRLAAVYSTRAGSNDLRYRYALFHPEEKRWKEGQLAYAGNYLYRPEFDYAGGVVLDPDDVNRVYFASNVNPRTGQAIAGGRYEIYQALTGDNGVTWGITAVTENSALDNIRPFVPRTHPDQTTVLWCRGVYQAYDRYKTKIVGVSVNR
jgi:hypothetical protein